MICYKHSHSWPILLKCGGLEDGLPHATSLLPKPSTFLWHIFENIPYTINAALPPDPDLPEGRFIPLGKFLVWSSTC